MCAKNIMIFRSQVTNCTPGIGLGSGATAASLVGGHCARPSGDTGAGKKCHDASAVSEDLHTCTCTCM